MLRHYVHPGLTPLKMEGPGRGWDDCNRAREKEQKQSFRRVICLIQQSCEKRLGRRGGGKEGKDG